MEEILQNYEASAKTLVTAYLPLNILALVDSEAKRQNVSRSKYIAYILAKEVKKAGELCKTA